MNTPLFLRLADILVPLRLIGLVDLEKQTIQVGTRILPCTPDILDALAPYVLNVAPSIEPDSTDPVPGLETSQDELEEATPTYETPHTTIAPRRVLGLKTSTPPPSIRRVTTPLIDVRKLRERIQGT